ncbi:MAG: hypothetical protein VKK04_16750 [Synechococcales bacterium]|nr:hypothetical protein [Synechococcales bacterium]
MKPSIWLKLQKILHRLLVLLLVGWVALVVAACAAQPDLCRVLNNHTICILSIKRSAKNYWEYRAAVSVDGVRRPVEVYDCRDRHRIQSDGRAIAFESQGAGDLICRLLPH